MSSLPLSPSPQSSASPPAPPLLDARSPSYSPGTPCCNVKPQDVQPPASPLREDLVAPPLIHSHHLSPLASPWLLPPSAPPDTLAPATPPSSLVPPAPPWPESLCFHLRLASLPLRSVSPPPRFQPLSLWLGLCHTGSTSVLVHSGSTSSTRRCTIALVFRACGVTLRLSVSLGSTSNGSSLLVVVC